VGAGHAGDKGLRDVINFCKTQWRIEPSLLHSTKQGSRVQNGYEQPEKLGVDRWLALTGAVARYGKPVVVWDLGTATTIDAVDENGQHVGGMICPGPATMLKSLGSETRLKVPVDLSAAGLSPGRSTADGIRNGVLAAQIGALNQFMRHAPESIGTDPKLVITGGAAAEVIPLLEFPFIDDPWLVFRGMLTEGIR
jgi:type III pantothenate kinase